ncbi:MAG: rhomboid family intramembrane serine protease [Candidatus Methanoliparum thermophilum]|uniref:Rhomboid family intramembrane serine protease n=1 Tax=Methanoliparum thermophilum TaxID=2491083 RepID=A0A520KT91_METT2|nr:rhomboid family intramembrane serine protease [Candidatus Methanoliparum sp. LAM-1]RZN65104.1 MAG: rhomboid family intramembrane serine protease [Candidatus Methanoliparum thermophilum]BDC36003.1 rhomboid family intramembrane serine protease [Candidatus Methanoliparum sp. LAM-1]
MKLEHKIGINLTNLPYSLIIVFLCILVALFQVLIPLFTDINIEFINLFGLSRYVLFVQHNIWTIVTYMFLHGNFGHLFFNMIALFFLGPELERRIGRKLFLIVYFVSGILSGVGHILFISNPMIPVIGASGAIFGVLACLAIIAPRMTIYIYFFPIKMIYALLFFILINLIMLPLDTDVAYFAHLIGLIVGSIFGVILNKKAYGPGRI